MPKQLSQITSRFKNLNRNLSFEYPHEAIEALIKHFENYQSHLSRDGDVMSRKEYMNLLQGSADLSYIFLGSSRSSARELLWGKYGFPKWWYSLRERLFIYLKFTILNVIPIIFTCATITYSAHKLFFVDPNTLQQIKGAFYLMMIIIFCLWIYFAYQQWRKNIPQEFITQDDARNIYSRFTEYNEKVRDRPNSKFPTLRLFVLDRKEINKDQKKINRKVNKTWWQVLVEHHSNNNIKIGLICLTNELRKEHPELLNQFSLFIIPGKGGWAIILKEEHLPQVVHICIKGTEVGHTYGGLCRAIRGLARMYILDEESGIKETKARIPDISKCPNCPDDGNELCKMIDFNKDCPRINKEATI